MADVVPLQLSGARARKVIREIAADTSRIVIVRHARQRQRQRGITRRQIELCVQLGTISEGPFMNSHGNWQVSMYRHAAGEELTCAVAIDWPNRVIVITAY